MGPLLPCRLAAAGGEVCGGSAAGGRPCRAGTVAAASSRLRVRGWPFKDILRHCSNVGASASLVYLPVHQPTTADLKSSNEASPPLLVPCREGASDGLFEQLQRTLRQADRDLSRGLRSAQQTIADGVQTLAAPPLSPVSSLLEIRTTHTGAPGAKPNQALEVSPGPTATAIFTSKRCLEVLKACTFLTQYRWPTQRLRRGKGSSWCVTCTRFKTDFERCHPNSNNTQCCRPTQRQRRRTWSSWHGRSGQAVNIFLNDVIPYRRPTQRRHSRTGSSWCGRCGRWWTANSWMRGIPASTAAPGLPRATPHY